jgi:hypothetical protein
MFSFIVNAFKAVNHKDKIKISIIKSAKQMRAMPLMMTYYLMHSGDVCSKDEANTDSNKEEISHSILYTESNTLDNVYTI